MNKFDEFINKNADTQLAQYIASQQKEVSRLLEKEVFKGVISEDDLSNV